MEDIQWRECIDFLAERTIYGVAFTGGEPFLRPDLFELINYVRSVQTARPQLETAIASECWQTFKNREYLPEMCNKCPHMFKCDGGGIGISAFNQPLRAPDDFRKILSTTKHKLLSFFYLNGLISGRRTS